MCETGLLDPFSTERAGPATEGRLRPLSRDLDEPIAGLRLHGDRRRPVQASVDHEVHKDPVEQVWVDLRRQAFRDMDLGVHVGQGDRIAGRGRHFDELGPLRDGAGLDLRQRQQRVDQPGGSIRTPLDRSSELHPTRLLEARIIRREQTGEAEYGRRRAKPSTDARGVRRSWEAVATNRRMASLTRRSSCSVRRSSVTSLITATT